MVGEDEYCAAVRATQFQLGAARCAVLARAVADALGAAPRYGWTNDLALGAYVASLLRGRFSQEEVDDYIRWLRLFVANVSPKDPDHAE